jgi:CSLREA domain-containing protein
VKKRKTNKVLSIVLLLISMSVVPLLSREAEAKIFKVNSTDDIVDATPGDGVCATGTGVCTLRAAIQEANALPGADEIRLKAEVYRLMLVGANEDLAATGDLDITDSVTIVGKGAAYTTVDGNHTDRVFHVFGPISHIVNFVGLKIQNGFIDGGLNGGGGILNEYDDTFTGATVTVSRCTISNNVCFSQIGGGIASYLGVLKIVSSLVTQNQLYSDNVTYGGGIYSYVDVLKIIEVNISDNHVGSTFSAAGGGVLAIGSAVKIKNSKILGNTADNWNSNSPFSQGGGLYVSGTLTANIINTKIMQNAATGIFGYGGGVFLEEAEASFSGCTIKGNSAFGISGGTGGGIHMITTQSSRTVTLSNLSHVTNNFASSGGGIYIVGPPTLLVSADSIVAGNSQDDIFP